MYYITIIKCGIEMVKKGGYVHLMTHSDRSADSGLILIEKDYSKITWHYSMFPTIIHMISEIYFIKYRDMIY